MKAEKKSDWLKLPNVLSLLRILLIPVFLVLMVNRKTAEAALCRFDGRFRWFRGSTPASKDKNRSYS